MYKISVVICTYNRSKLLPGTLETLVNQIIDKSLCEFIVMTIPQTKETGDKYLAETNIRCIFELKQRLSDA